MERIVGPHMAPMRAALLKVALDQGCFAPFFNLVFISSLAALQGLSAGETWAKLKAEYKDVMLTMWKIWPAVQLANFTFVPFLLRPLVVSVVALFWNTFLSWKTNSSSNKEEAAAIKAE